MYIFILESMVSFYCMYIKNICSMHVCIRSLPQTIPLVKRVGGFISLVGGEIWSAEYKIYQNLKTIHNIRFYYLSIRGTIERNVKIILLYCTYRKNEMKNSSRSRIQCFRLMCRLIL